MRDKAQKKMDKNFRGISLEKSTKNYIWSERYWGSRGSSRGWADSALVLRICFETRINSVWIFFWFNKKLQRMKIAFGAIFHPQANEAALHQLCPRKMIFFWGVTVLRWAPDDEGWTHDKKVAGSCTCRRPAGSSRRIPTSELFHLNEMSVSAWMATARKRRTNEAGFCNKKLIGLKNALTIKNCSKCCQKENLWKSKNRKYPAISKALHQWLFVRADGRVESVT